MKHPLTKFRKQNGLTLEQLAHKAGISKSFLSEIENGASFGWETGEALEAATDKRVKLEQMIKARRPKAPAQ